MADARASRVKNQLLSALPADEWERLRPHAELAHLTAGETFVRSGDAIRTVLFPTSGLFAVLGVLETGHHVGLFAVGSDGFVGVPVLFGWQAPYEVVVEVPVYGYAISAGTFRSLVQDLTVFHDLAFGWCGRVLYQMARAGACNRFHSHRQRLARWLLVASEKARRPSLHLTHDMVAQLVGGQRHAVTAALNELRAQRVIRYHRSIIEVADPRMLRKLACNCYLTDLNATNNNS